MSKPNQDKPVATVNEEPKSTPTKNGPIDQGSQEQTRNAGKAHSPAEQQSRPHGDGGGCGCGH